jgi:hypothetical protein
MSASVQHLDEEQLLRYADGELAPREANQARAHLEACWQCRVEFEELQKTIAECVRYRKDIQQFLPQPPSPWADIYLRFGEIDRSLDRPSLFQKAAKWFRWSMVPKWVPVPIALILAALLIYRLKEAPAVQAAELLRKAVAAADSRGAQPRMIQIRTKHQQIRRAAVTQDASSPESGSLEALFASAHYNWQDPLSAKSYQEWRDQLSERRDEIRRKSDGYVIQTETSSGPLTQASLRLSILELRPIEEHLQFGDNEWVEVTEVAPETSIAENSMETKETQPKATAEVTPEAPSPSVNPTTPVHTASIGDELQVMLALHKISADLGDPIEVSLKGDQVLVTGVGVPAQRQQEIRNALAANPNVIVRLNEPVASTSAAPAPRLEGTVNADMSQLQAKVAEKVGGRVHFEELSSQVLDLSDQMMARAYALRRLAERFPADVTLNPDDAKILADLRQEHTLALVHLSTEIERTLRPVFTSLGVDSRSANLDAGLSLAWQPATEEVFQSARQVEKLVAVLFGAAQNDAAGQQIPAQLLTDLSQLRTRLAAYARIG